MEPLELEIEVACSPEHAFELWAVKTSLWWPWSHSVSGDPKLSIVIEPRVGGRIYERASDGVEHEWGEILVWEPPSRLAYLWHLRQDRADATEVDIRFAAAGNGTAVSIVHSGWERLGASGSFPDTSRRVSRQQGRARWNSCKNASRSRAVSSRRAGPWRSLVRTLRHPASPVRRQLLAALNRRPRPGPQSGSGVTHWTGVSRTNA